MPLPAADAATPTAPASALELVSAAGAALERREPGIWFARRQGAVSYPEGGNAVCRQIEDHSFWFAHRNRCLLALVRRFPVGGGPFLDIGAGNGFVAQALRGAGVDCAVLEPGPEGALASHRRGLSPVVCARLEEAGLPEGRWGAAGMFDVLEHIEQDGAALARARDLLLPGGRLWLTVPAYEALRSREDAEAGHFRRYTIGGLGRLLPRAGFRVEFATHIFAALVLPIFLLRTLPSRLGLGGPAGAEDAAKVARDHAPGGGAGRVLQRLLDAELRRLEAGRPVPFGASCLVVAARA